MKTTGAAPSRSVSQDVWDPSFEDLKHYPHFDAPLKLSEIRSIVNSPVKVAHNAFFPLIQYEKRWQPFRGSKANPKPDPKIRKIRYAARRAAYIYAKYRRILSPLYEARISSLGISDIPIAYRKIVGAGGKGKCNIDFAKDAFGFIASMPNSFVITLDISKFFESLDHQMIRKIWTDLLEADALPADHEAVLNSLTNYRWVDRIEVYERLGYFGKKLAKNGTLVQGYLKPFKDIPKQLCKPKEFREKIAGSKHFSSIIRKNLDDFGIPQGTPISDLVANMYLMNFDVYLKEIADSHNGRAFRYSDDIMLVVAVEDQAAAENLEKQVRLKMPSFGNQLVIKESKSSIHEFNIDSGSVLRCRHIKGAGKNGLEYLGFRFDGSKVFLRDSTVSNLKRKLTFAARIRAEGHKRRYSNRTPVQLIDSFNFDHLFQTFMRVEEFDKAKSVKSWTFWTYARRASETFGAPGKPILKQLKFLKSDGKRLVETVLS
ncbi:hypothetical protein N5J77_18610 [Sphingobium yanoikuyae]|uniref:Reverse transcriptase domain-containing protein n=2 Tax=Sphingobium yanoikuyae TaxID=13690 RepID=A0AA42WZH7_SPHYA|nr:hypothetical protein [Sphingobium yanoikuyae]MDH2133147.1 hypothetical protein [Sphingobium yanoikuyae]MDH2168697.1 hypothetical protein [Sphingobium yanoikuyae]